MSDENHDFRYETSRTLGRVEGELSSLPRLHERAGKSAEEVAYLKGQVSLLCDEVKALRRTVDDLLLRTAPALPPQSSRARKPRSPGKPPVG